MPHHCIYLIILLLYGSAYQALLFYNHDLFDILY
uniref:Uncharacterized protein n=1 Tax=Arundo donax TaxID=35708 RepID=A0A0A8ZS99_ARUDO